MFPDGSYLFPVAYSPPLVSLYLIPPQHMQQHTTHILNTRERAKHVEPYNMCTDRTVNIHVQFIQHIKHKPFGLSVLSLENTYHFWPSLRLFLSVPSRTHLIMCNTQILVSIMFTDSPRASRRKTVCGVCARPWHALGIILSSKYQLSGSMTSPGT